jgi:hypothetical protein
MLHNKYPMAKMCTLCNQSWGDHAGYNCPDGSGKFVPEPVEPVVRCCALDSEGNSCMYAATGRYQYFGSSELYSLRETIPHWLAVPLCDHHAGKDTALPLKENS